MQMKTVLIAMVLSASFAASAQQTQFWQRSRIQDPLHAISFDEFILNGIFLKPPKIYTGGAPSLILHCDNGKFIDGHLAVRGVVDYRAGRGEIEMRLDEKLSKEYWTASTDGTSLFMDNSTDFLKIIYGTWLPHKEGKGAPIRKEIFGVQEAFGATVMMQFDMPDPKEVLDSCTTLKRGRRF